MVRKQFLGEGILKVLRQGEVDLSFGSDIKTACGWAGMSDAAY